MFSKFNYFTENAGEGARGGSAASSHWCWRPIWLALPGLVSNGRLGSCLGVARIDFQAILPCKDARPMSNSVSGFLRRHRFVLALLLLFIALSAKYSRKALHNRSAVNRWLPQIIEMENGQDISR